MLMEEMIDGVPTPSHLVRLMTGGTITSFPARIFSNLKKVNNLIARNSVALQASGWRTFTHLSLYVHIQQQKLVQYAVHTSHCLTRLLMQD